MHSRSRKTQVACQLGCPNVYQTAVLTSEIVELVVSKTTHDPISGERGLVRMNTLILFSSHPFDGVALLGVAGLLMTPAAKEGEQGTLFCSTALLSVTDLLAAGDCAKGALFRGDEELR